MKASFIRTEHQGLLYDERIGIKGLTKSLFDVEFKILALAPPQRAIRVKLYGAIFNCVSDDDLIP